MCEVCAKGVAIRLQRGTKLSERRCQCGAALTMAAWKEGGYVARSPDKERAIREQWEARGLQFDGYARDLSFSNGRF